MLPNSQLSAQLIDPTTTCFVGHNFLLILLIIHIFLQYILLYKENVQENITKLEKFHLDLDHLLFFPDFL